MIPNIFHIVYFAAINLAMVLLGYVLLKKKLVFLSWVMLVVGIATVYVVFQQDHPIIKMLAIIATTFTGMKAIAAIGSYKDKSAGINFKQWTAFAGGWAGMRPQPFETLGHTPLPNAGKMIWFGISRAIIGLLLIFVAHKIVSLPLSVGVLHILVTTILLVSLSLILHFGLLSISAGIWRLSGANTYYLFRKPALATSLTEFWSKRWNIAFSEMTSVAIFRPLKNKIGSPAALMIAFIFSGLLHELALSLPVNSGYGLPTLYFIIQGALVLVEKALTNNGFVFLQNKIIARIWVFVWLVGPIPLLFHAEFIRQIVWPLAGLHY